MHCLYPNIRPYSQEMLPRGNQIQLYIEQCGQPDGIPIVFVHGGPGNGCSDQDRRFFDPEKYRIILFDQRGAGRTLPHASLDDNHTQALIDDMEAIRKYLGVTSWVLFGGSWGATLSLLYAQQHSDKVLGMILRGTFLCREQDLNWLYQDGLSRIFPDYWRAFLEPIPKAEQNHLIQAYYQRLCSKNELEKMGAAKAWSQWEAHCATLHPNHSIKMYLTAPHTALALARIESHYFLHCGFIEENQIINDARRLSSIPGIVIHGRYDMICPLENATSLAAHWPEAELRIIREAGHAAEEPSLVDALVRATNDMAKRFQEDFLNLA